MFEDMYAQTICQIVFTKAFEGHKRSVGCHLLNMLHITQRCYEKPFMWLLYESQIE